MACSCGAKNAGKANFVRKFAIVDDVRMANTPNLIPDSDKFSSIDEAVAANNGRHIVQIVEG